MSDSVNQKKPSEKKEEKKKYNWKRVLLIVLGAILALFLLLYGAYHLILEYYLGMINIVTKETGLEFETQLPTGVETQIPEVDHHGQLNKDNLPLICDTPDVTNILLMATDSRENEAGLSDTMILLSINEKTEKIVLCSFMRDIYVYYPDEPQSKLSGKYYKLNGAHAYGGPELTLAVIKENFNIDIDYYAKVNFTSFVTIAQALGGIEMELTTAEIEWINLFVDSPEIAEIFPDTPKTHLPVKAGTYRLTGLQALGHARNRRVGSDFARTERQRDIIIQMMKQGKDLSISELDNLLTKTLPLVTTNIPKDMLKAMVGNAFSYFGYEVTSTRIPLNGTYTEVEYNIIPDAVANCTDLYEKIYGEKAPTLNEPETAQ